MPVPGQGQGLAERRKLQKYKAESETCDRVCTGFPLGREAERYNKLPGGLAPEWYSKGTIWEAGSRQFGNVRYTGLPGFAPGWTLAGNFLLAPVFFAFPCKNSIVLPDHEIPSV